jgi:hypothetical protein
LFTRETDNSDYVPYNASGNARHNTVFLDNRCLSCRGFVVGEISGLSARGAGYFKRDLNTIVSPDEFSSVYGDFRATAEAVARTLIADRDVYGQRATKNHTVILQLPSTFDHAKQEFVERGWKWLAGQENYYYQWEGFRSFNDFFQETLPSDATEYDVTDAYACFNRSS